ncbi:HAMP domain-containing histidine kinase [Cellulophaga baltica]|uniref:sensor histidine kinase n=1 Tax=Cellulophaga TaxID=104264 RepID=UPI001C070E72|nr:MULTISPECIES: HAMP domain-containing sensor histidine kinase [Cellulophaga]MBU2995297.1 HAMP domain-containing histidine kinase [Cellulophaga baltica]MDO6766692.1 HAMP domain-containing sensor histidine kinase [Cellulophaga sp. 1_MG-2023]
MLPIRDKLNNPFVVVTLALFIAVAGYLISDYFVHWIKFWLGLYLAIALPIIIALPIAFILQQNFKKINTQKKELEHLDTINKKLFLLISHDVRSPLASLIGTIDLVANNDIDSDEAKLYFKELSKKVKNVNIFLDGLLDWSRRQTQNKPLSFVTFEALQAIKPMWELLEHEALKKNITINTNNLNTKMYADIDSYTFVFRNILQNAIKFTKQSGIIVLETKEINGLIHTIISDTGVGIHTKEIEKILKGENWYTTKGTSEEKGTGFGLRTCLYYLKKNNGDLLIDSEVGKGTKVSILLPKG